MSLDGNLLSRYTELEIAAGVPDLVEGRYDPYLGDDEDDEEEGADNDQQRILSEDERKLAERRAEAGRLAERQADTKRQADTIRLLSGINDKAAMRGTLFRKLLANDISYLVQRYANKERLPDLYLKIVEADDCIVVLVKNFLIRRRGFSPTTKLVGELEDLASEVLLNTKMDTAYHRVGKIQQFIYEKIAAAFGEKAITTLPVAEMRDLLSACRLHLGINDIRHRDGLYLQTVADRSAQAAASERATPSAPPASRLRFQFHYVPHWKVRHLRSLDYFARVETRKIIQRLFEVNALLPIDDYRACLVTAYSSPKIKGK